MSKKLSQSDSVNEMVGSEIKLAGNENKVKMYESKHKRKLIRVLTVVAYVFFVSLAAIMLSLFYMFIYNPSKLTVKKNMGIGFTDNLVYQPKLQEPEGKFLKVVINSNMIYISYKIYYYNPINNF